MRTNQILAIAFAFCGMITLTSCEKEEETSPVVNTNLYFEASMDGKTLTLPEGKDGYASRAAKGNETLNSGCVETQRMEFFKPSDSKKSFQIILLKQKSNCNTSCAESTALLHEGAYSFGHQATSSDQTVTDGVILRYTDVYGVVWSTDYTIADQTGSSFSITQMEENTKDNTSEMLATAQFNCKLYNADGEEIVVTEGKIVSRSIVCQ